jgi:hypothetical protein
MVQQHWKDLLTTLEVNLNKDKFEMSSEKMFLIEKHLTSIYKTDSYKTLIFVEDPICAYVLTKFINEVEFKDTSNNRRNISCKLYCPQIIEESQNIKQNDFTVEEFKKETKRLKDAPIDPQAQAVYDLGLYYSLLEDILTERFLLAHDPSIFLKNAAEIQKKNNNIIISTEISQSLLSNPNTKIILFDEIKFRNIIFNPSVLSGKLEIISLRTKNEELIRKIAKIDRRMK